MLLFLLAWDNVVQGVLLVPIVLYALGNKSMAPLALLDSVVLFVIAVLWVRKQLMRDRASVQHAPPPETCRWRKGFDPAIFLGHVTLFLRVRGWRVLSTQIMGPDRAAFVAQNGSFRLAALCLRPGAELEAADMQTLETMARQNSASRAVLVVADKKRIPPPAAAESSLALLEDAGPRILQFEDLPHLSDIIGLNS
jgi:hypothetical protein